MSAGGSHNPRKTMKIVSACLALASVLAMALCPPFALAETIGSTGAIACISQKGLWRFLDARDLNDSEAVRQLLKGECRALNAVEYSVVADHNGTVKILVFKKPGDWETAETLYTLDEMLDSSNAWPFS
jgi:hypothetical protein